MSHPENVLPHQFKPGVSGNPKGRPPGKSPKRLAREVAESKNRRLIEKLYEKAFKGDVRAMELIVKLWQDDTSSLTGDITISFARNVDPTDEDDDEPSD